MLQTTNKIIKNKVGLLNLAEELNNVSKACKLMGFSRDTFYRYQKAVEEGGVDSLMEKTRRKPNLKNRIDETTEKSIIEISLELPAYGQVRISNELRKKGIIMSPAGVRCVQLRNGLENTKKRLKVLEEKVSKEGLILTERQLQALEKKQIEEGGEVGQIETMHPGYLGSQDTYYVWDQQGNWSYLSADLCGHLYESGFCQIVQHAGLLSPRLIFLMTRFFHFLRIRKWVCFVFSPIEGLSIVVKPMSMIISSIWPLMILTILGPRPNLPRPMVFVRGFHRTIKGEFYEVVFRKKIFKTLEQLQTDS